MNLTCSLCTLGRGPGTQPCSVTQSAPGLVGRICEKPASCKEARPLLPSNCAGTQLLPSNQRCFLPKMERWDRRAAFAFSGQPTSLKVVGITSLQSQPWSWLLTPPPAQCQNPGNAGSPGWDGTVCREQSGDAGHSPASAKSLGNLLNPLCNEQVDTACLPVTCQVAVKYEMREAILSHRSLWEGRPLLSTSDCAFTSVTSCGLPVPVRQDK